MKKKIAFLLMITMAMSLLAFSGLGTAYAADSDFTTEVILKKTWLTAYNGAGGDVVIPNEVEKIGYRAFYNKTSVTSVVIPDTVTYIDAAAFQGCSNLQSITIPDSVKGINKRAFANCGLKQVSIPAKFAAQSFSNKLGAGTVDTVEEVTIRSTEEYTTVGTLTFSAASSEYGTFSGLKKVVILEGITAIESKAFQGLTSPLTVVIPESVTSIASDAFDGCTNVTINSRSGTAAQNYANAHSEIAFRLEDSFSVTTDGTLVGYSGSGGNLVIPESVFGIKINKIGDCAFKENTTLTGVTIPKGVTKIGDSAFSGCHNLSSVSIPDTVLDIGAAAFVATAITDIAIPDSVKTIGESAFYSTALTKISIPEGVREIGDYAFCYNSSLVTASLPGSLTTIGSMIFGYCSGLR